MAHTILHDTRVQGQKIIHDQLGQSIDALWFFDAAPLPSKRFFDGLGLLHVYDAFRERMGNGRWSPPESRKKQFVFFEAVIHRVLIPLLLVSTLALYGTILAAHTFAGQPGVRNLRNRSIG